MVFFHFSKNNLYSRQANYFLIRLPKWAQIINATIFTPSSILLGKRTKSDVTCESKILYSTAYGRTTAYQFSGNAFYYSTPSAENSVSLADMLVVTRTDMPFLPSFLARSVDFHEMSFSRKAEESAFLNINLANRKCNIRYVSHGCQ